MIRIVTVDDSSNFDLTLNKIKKEIEEQFNVPVETLQINPNDYSPRMGQQEDSAAFLQAISDVSLESCDIFAIDIQLNDSGPSPRLSLALQTVEVFRNNNRSAIVIFYSGTLAKFIKEWVEQDSSPTKKTAEAGLRNIFKNQVAGFFSRADLEVEIIAALKDLPMVLRIEKELLANKTRKVRGEISIYKGKTFLELSGEVRKQSDIGKDIVDMIVKQGTSDFVDYNL